MATRLRFRFIDRVDLVDRGANPDAHIVLVKRAPEEVPDVGNASAPEADVAKDDEMEAQPLTTGEIVARQAAMEDLCRVKAALCDSIYRIFEHAPLADQPTLLIQSVQEFATFARQAIQQMGATRQTCAVAHRTGHHCQGRPEDQQRPDAQTPGDSA